MKKAVITVTEAARNFADCVNRAHYQDTSFVLLKNGKPFARLVPGSEKVCTGRELAEALGKSRTYRGRGAGLAQRPCRRSTPAHRSEG